MHDSIKKLCDVLDEVEQEIKTVAQTNSIDENVLLNTRGNVFPPVKINELIAATKQLSFDIKNASLGSLSPQTVQNLNEFSNSILALKDGAVRMLFNGDGQPYILVFLGTINHIRQRLAPDFGYFIGYDPNLKPTAIKKRYTSLQNRMDALEPELDSISEKIQEIIGGQTSADLLKSLVAEIQAFKDNAIASENAAKESAESAKNFANNGNTLFVDFQKYRLQKENEINEQSQVIIEKLNQTQNAVNEKISHFSEKIENEINAKKELLNRLILELENTQKIAASTTLKADEALKIATTTGLAGSFQEQAILLRKKSNWWVLFLVLALILAVVIAVLKFYFVIELLGKEILAPDQLWFQIGTTLLLISPFIWFSWLATKQIGNLFRLSEDYQFKASVAKSYEGYRKEAKAIDSEFEKSLFKSLLERFGEAPLRHVEKKVHGSFVTELLDNFKRSSENKETKISPSQPQVNSESNQT